MYQSVSICPFYKITFHLRSNELLCLIDLFWFVCETEQSGQLQRAKTGSTPNLKNDFPRPWTRLSLSKYGALPRVRGSRPRVCPSCLLCPHLRDVGEFPGLTTNARGIGGRVKFVWRQPQRRVGSVTPMWGGVRGESVQSPHTPPCHYTRDASKH